MSGDLELAHALGGSLSGEREMGASMVVLVFPAAQFRGELAGRTERRPSIELLPVRAVAALNFAVDLGAARRDMPMGDPEIPEMPSEISAELIAMVRLDALDGHGKPLAHLVDEGDRARDGVVGVDPEDPVAGGLVDRGELIKAPPPSFRCLTSTWTDWPGTVSSGRRRGPGRYRFIETRGTPCRLRIL